MSLSATVPPIRLRKRRRLRRQHQHHLRRRDRDVGRRGGHRRDAQGVELGDGRPSLGAHLRPLTSGWLSSAGRTDSLGGARLVCHRHRPQQSPPPPRRADGAAAGDAAVGVAEMHEDAGMSRATSRPRSRRTLRACCPPRRRKRPRSRRRRRSRSAPPTARAAQPHAARRTTLRRTPQSIR